MSQGLGYRGSGQVKDINPSVLEPKGGELIMRTTVSGGAIDVA